MDDHQENLLSLAETIRTKLRADCEKCFGLCCVALYFSASEGFPQNKEPGLPCVNMQSDFSCRVHKNLTEQGLKGCIAYDCFGAGQKVAQVSYSGLSWREYPEPKQVYEVFLIMCRLHELLWYLTEALTLEAANPIHIEIKAMLAEIERLTYLSPDALLKLDLAVYRVDVDKQLSKTSELVRAEVSRGQKENSRYRKNILRRGADLMGADLKSIDLRGANLRGAYLIAADLRGTDLSGVDIIGADLRDVDLRGANLTKSIFLTQTQINSAKGDLSTKLPVSLIYPQHWDN